jgi:hypothetical protein
VSTIRQLKCTLSQEFNLYCIEKLLSENILTLHDDSNNNIDIASYIAFDQNFKLFRESIEKVGFYYIDFWNIFIQDDNSKIIFLFI